MIGYGIRVGHTLSHATKLRLAESVVQEVSVCGRMHPRTLQLNDRLNVDWVRRYRVVSTAPVGVLGRLRQVKSLRPCPTCVKALEALT